jgi:hypothetical protein
LLSLILAACTDAASVPILYCVNEAASAGDCSSEASQAAESTKDWFDEYMTTHADQSRNRRHLLDCSRFCSSEVTYFTIHYPCDCKKDRRLTVLEIPHKVRTLQNHHPLVGPIQFFKSFTSELPSSPCRTVLEMSRCFITFVDKYDHEFSVPESEKEDESDIPSDYYLNESYNPKTGKYEVYDPETGELVAPKNTTSNNGDEGEDEIPDEIYDPKTNKYYEVDPITGEFIKGEGGNTSPAVNGNSNDDAPVTKKYHKVDPNSGKYVDNDDETPSTKGVDGNEMFSEEVYDPVTGVYHKVDPVTGEYIDDVKQYEEVYDPATGEYRKIDPTTGKYVP